jgi:DAHL domain/Protein kinase domain
MMRWPLHLALAAAAVALVVVFALSRPHAVAPEAHEAYSRGLRMLAAKDAALNDAVLQTDKGILRHYDPVVRTLAELRRLPVELHAPPAFLSADGRADVQRHLDAFIAELSKKEERIEQFKSEAAVLRNSVHYFPIAAEAFEKESADRGQAMAMGRLLRHLLLYNQRPDPDLRRAVETSLAELGEHASGRATDDELELLRTHARVILERRPTIEAALKEIGALPTARRAEETYAAYDRHYQRAIEVAGVYRLFIYVLGAIVIMLVAGEALWKLRSSALALKRERENVERLLLNAPGVVIGQRFHLERRLGEGGMGVVWAARHAATGAPVALKFVKHMGAARRDVRRRFLREARAASLIDHPNVVRIHEILELEDGSPVLVMDLLVGRSLGEHLREHGAIALGEAGAILLPVIEAVSAAHARGIIHRDLKPDNIFLEELGGKRLVRVLDFGSAKLTASEGDAALSGQLTRTGDMVGTPFYMSPEQAFGEPGIDARSDVWALGVILYECLSGRRPFDGENPGQLLKSILSAEAPPIAGVPDEVSALMRAMLVKQRAARTATLEQIAAVLTRHAA